MSDHNGLGARVSALEEELGRLTDLQAIQDVLARYSRALDWLDALTEHQDNFAYHAQTAPLVPFYDGEGLLKRVDGVGKPNEVTERIITVLG